MRKAPKEEEADMLAVQEDNINKQEHFVVAVVGRFVPVIYGNDQIEWSMRTGQ